MPIPICNMSFSMPSPLKWGLSAIPSSSIFFFCPSVSVDSSTALMASVYLSRIRQSLTAGLMKAMPCSWDGSLKNRSIGADPAHSSVVVWIWNGAEWKGHSICLEHAGALFVSKVQTCSLYDIEHQEDGMLTSGTLSLFLSRPRTSIIRPVTPLWWQFGVYRSLVFGGREKRGLIVGHDEAKVVARSGCIGINWAN